MSVGTTNMGAMSRSGFTFQPRAGVQPFPLSVTKPFLPRCDLPAGPLHMVLILLLLSSPRRQSGSCLHSCQAGAFRSSGGSSLPSSLLRCFPANTARVWLQPWATCPGAAPRLRWARGECPGDGVEAVPGGAQRLSGGAVTAAGSSLPSLETISSTSATSAPRLAVASSPSSDRLGSCQFLVCSLVLQLLLPRA